jgi:hypothetical protein
MALSEAPHLTGLTPRDSGVVVPAFVVDRVPSSPIGKPETALMLQLLGLDTRRVTTYHLRDFDLAGLTKFIWSTKFNTLEHCLVTRGVLPDAANNLNGKVSDIKTRRQEGFADLKVADEYGVYHLNLSTGEKKKIARSRQAQRIVENLRHQAFDSLDLSDSRKALTSLVAQQVPEGKGPQLAHEFAMINEVNLKQVHSYHEVLSVVEGDTPRVRALGFLRGMYAEKLLPVGYLTEVSGDESTKQNFAVLELT